MPFFLVVASIVLIPATALAFGPVAHVDLGMDLVAHAIGIGTGVFALIRDHQRDFLRGTLGPDREVAKNLAPYLKHSHNWNRAFLRYRDAPDAAGRSFFLGWLCHLAADAVSHNYLVPLKTVESHRSVFASHVYWEMRFDARARTRGGDWALKTLGLDEKEHRRFLATVVPGNVLGPRFNVRMTGLAIRVQRALAFRKASAYVDRESRLRLTEEDEDDVRRLAFEAQLGLLKKLERSPVVRLDPRGTVAISLARRIRRQLRALVRRMGEPNPEAARVVAQSRQYFRSRLAAAIRGQSASGSGVPKVPEARRASGRWRVS
jgi:hypothetical protein